jgi:hypothetical protein
MNSNTLWSFEPGTSGVLAPGPWLWLRAVLWALLLASCTLAIFLATQFPGPWLHLPANSNCAIVFLFAHAGIALSNADLCSYVGRSDAVMIDEIGA